jgi:hypothetical protein
MIADRWCEGPGCKASIAYLRPQAKFCSAACRKAAERRRNRDRLGHRTVSLSGEEGYFNAFGSTRGYLDDWQPRDDTKLMLGRVQQIMDEYADQLPLTCRQIYYRMIAQWRYPKGVKFERALYSVLDSARRAEEIAFEDIRDDGIMGGGWWPKRPEDLLSGWRLEAKSFNRDAQDGQAVRVQVWCEAAGMIPQLTRVCDPYSIPVFSCGGFGSLTSIRQIVDSCVQDTEGPTVLLHLGDCDPSGYSIFQAMVEDVAEFLERDRRYDEQEFQFERVAITIEQFRDKTYELEGDEITTKDSRSVSWRKQGLTHKVELEAMSPDVIARLLTETIERYVDLDHIKRIRAEQEIERDALRDAADMATSTTATLLKGDSLGRLLERYGRDC